MAQNNNDSNVVSGGGSNRLRCDINEMGNATQEISKQVNTIQNEALSPLKGIVSEITSGIWIGKGADAFVDELINMIIPSVTDVIGMVAGFNSNLKNTVSGLQDADGQVAKLVEGFAGDEVSSFIKSF